MLKNFVLGSTGYYPCITLPPYSLTKEPVPLKPRQTMTSCGITLGHTLKDTLGYTLLINTKTVHCLNRSEVQVYVTGNGVEVYMTKPWT